MTADTGTDRTTRSKIIHGLHEFTLRFLPDLIGWTITVLLIVAIVTGTTAATWFIWTLGTLAGVWIGLVGIPAAVDIYREISYRRTLLDLNAMGVEHADPASGVWMITIPDDTYREWQVYAPGQCWPEAPYPHRDVTPTAVMSADNYDSPAFEATDGEIQPIERIRGWAVPWVEQISGGTVTEMLMGWGAPYGPDRIYREVTVYARVKTGA